MRINMVNTVRGFIIAHPQLADNDTELIWNVWKWHLEKNHKPAININSISAKKLFKLINEKDVPSMQNITRSRRKCQEMYPETRGDSYSSRHKEQEHVKEQLRSMNVQKQKEADGKSAVRAH